MDKMRKPNFFIVGAPKSGTTFLYHYLRQHPDIFMPEHKEPFYFGGDLDKKEDMELNDYLDLFSDAQGEERIGEASTGYLRSEKAAMEIYAFNPNSKIIIMLRNPIYMMYSLYHYFRWNGYEDLDSFESALQAEKCNTENSNPYRNHAKYSRHVSRFFSIFGSSNVHVIIFDDIQDNSLETYHNTLSFLGVNDSFTPSLTPINKAKKPFNNTIHRFIISPPDIVKNIAGLFLPTRTRGKIVATLRSINTVERKYEPLRAPLAAKLKKEFTPEVKHLSELLDRDLMHWVDVQGT